MNKLLRQLTADLLKTFQDQPDKVQHFDSSPLPDKQEIYRILADVQFLLFPGYFGEPGLSFDAIEEQIGYRVAHVFERLRTQVLRESLHTCRYPNPSCKHCHDYAGMVAQNLLAGLPALREILDLDVKAAFRNDPAATSFDEIIFSYPGLEAITIYRVAHLLVEQGLALIPRIMTEYAHSRTGIDIHPGARIGPGFFIDHGTGVVIGETTDIGCNVTLYQGVTLGALNFPRDAQGNVIRRAKRHPTIEAEVVIYAGATILGGNTVIGRGSVIGGNVWLTESVPPYSRVVMAKSELTITPRKPPEPGSAAAPAPSSGSAPTSRPPSR
ncbi:MAG: Serine acetyltransferase [Candidatus Ozemobacter sibiricus]|jgi:serine O-acetyltransferase|uniref:Serine acetyltransferase n=1 Tax=Candidatus Ozemobacter sibiricus TaxID=2268124 RepID=A0A367ZRF0_9BACT|nr:MAG: Serine acetyltransferase [Candidatus Ozemobacter sibiricus]